ncbi:MAG TPA: hypothetical protein VK020_01400 [Microlunatus sp.]|nr:hypothetical protein [Microlunatus sp.]
MIMRGLRTILIAALSVALLIWIGQGLLGIDQRGGLLALVPGLRLPDDLIFAPIMIGTAWGILLTFGGSSWAATSKRVSGPVAMATLIESRTTGLTINEVPQFQLFLEVHPTDGEAYVSQCRKLIRAAEQRDLVKGAPIPVHYDLTDPDHVTPADPADPEVRRAVLQWRVDRGLIEPGLVHARLHGTPERASVLELRPTGRHQDGQTELEVKLLVSPTDRPPFEAVSRAFVHPEGVRMLQVGSPVWAYWVPGDPNRVAVAITRDDAEQEENA